MFYQFAQSTRHAQQASAVRTSLAGADLTRVYDGACVKWGGQKFEFILGREQSGDFTPSELTTRARLCLRLCRGFREAMQCSS